jgi:hypothetical protein
LSHADAVAVSPERCVERRSLASRIPGEFPRQAGLVAGEAVVAVLAVLAALVAMNVTAESSALVGSVVCRIIAVRCVERASSGGDLARPGFASAVR